MTIEIQFASFITMGIVGFYLGCMFDTNERIIQAIKGSRIVKGLCQLVFWLIQSMIIFYLLVKVNGGQVRLYFIIAIIFGYWLYFLRFRKVYQRTLARIIQLIKAILLFIKKTITTIIIKPIKLLVLAFLTVINLVIMMVLKLFSFLLIMIGWLFRPILLIIPKNVRKYLVSLSKMCSKIIERVLNRKQK